MNRIYISAQSILIALRASYARIKAFLLALVRKYVFKPKKHIYGIVFQEQGKQSNTGIYLGQTIHIEPFGDCLSNPQTCVHAPIEKILVGKRTVLVTAKGMVITYVDVTIKTINER